MDNHSLIISSNNINEQLFNKFDNVLFSLDSELNPKEATLTKQEIYRRLSKKYVSSPRKFTEKLITIIEESVVNNTLNMNNCSINNFEKISKELQKMSKDIEDESMPEQLLCTTISTSPSKEMSKIMIDDQSNQITNRKRCLELPSFLNADSCTAKTPSPTNMCRKVYRKTPRNIFKSELKKVDDKITFSPSKYNDMSFQSLEAQCERLFPDEKKDRTSVQTIPDNSSLNMDRILTICEQQLASLNSTDDDIKVISHKKNGISVKEMNKKPQEISYNLHTIAENSAYKDGRRNKELKKINKLDNELDELDELDKTLLSEIVEKRQRCFDTAKSLMKINSECNAVTVQKKSKTDKKSPLNINSSKSNKAENSNVDFLKMLISCKDYHNYLENQLPMLNASCSSKNLSSDSNINKSNRKNININLIPRKKELSANTESNFKSRRSKLYTENYRKILARWNVESEINEKKTDKTENKSNLFKTPGKIPTRNKRIQRVFFSDLHTTKKQRSPLRVSLSRGKQLNNLNCNTMLSPARSYKRDSIKSTLQVTNNQISTKSSKSPLKKVSKVTVGNSPGRALIKQNLLALHKYNINKNKENQ